MEKNGSNSSNFAKLRRRAEAFLAKSSTAAGGYSLNDIRDLVEELRIHQVELEMQGEELRNACEELDEAKRIYEDLYDFAPVGYVTLDECHLISRANFLAARLLNNPKENLLRRPFSHFIAPEDVNLFYQYCNRCVETGKRQTCELKLKPKEASQDQLYVQLESRAFSNEACEHTGIRMALFDVTARKVAEERIRTLSQELLMAQEREREMISCELHDRIAQELSAIKMGCDSFLYGHSEIPQAIRDKASKLSDSLKAVITAVRDLSYELRPPDLDHDTLIEVIDRLCQEFSTDTGIETDFYSTGTGSLTLAPFTMTNIYRMFQEGLINIQKHAEASHVHAAISYSHPHLIIRITDNGKGFDVEKREAALTQEKRLGLRSMKERARLLGGTFTVKSSPMQGTQIQVRIPYEEKKSNG